MTVTLPLPNLDDRRWIDLVDEGRALVPFYAPDWTDHNAHDPGITLMELFAWIAEMDLYKVNRVTDAARRKLLALVGIAPEAPTPSEAMLHLALTSGVPPLRLPAGIEFVGHDPFDAPVRFRTRHDVTVQPGRIASVGTSTTGGRRDLTAAWERREALAPFGAEPAIDTAFYVGLELPSWSPNESIDLSLGFVVTDAASAPSRDERARIEHEQESVDAECTPPWATIPCPSPHCDGSPDDESGDGHDSAEVVRPPGRPELQHHDVHLVWEVATGQGQWTQLSPGGEVVDGTRALTLDGRVTVSLANITPAADGDDALVWLRARIARGAYDAAPVVHGLAFNAVEVVQSVPAAVRVPVAPGAHIEGQPPPPDVPAAFDVALDRAGEVDRLVFAPEPSGPPAVRVYGIEDGGRSVSIEAAALVRGTGEPSQVIVIEDAPLDAPSVRLMSHEDGRWRTWAARPDFDASGRADAHHVVDPTTGAIVLGDGEHGRTARTGSAMLVAADITRADTGNLGAGKVDTLADSRHNRAMLTDVAATAAQLEHIANVAPATGGRAAESLGAAVARARDGRERASRAVTLEDHVALARATPGARVARAEGRANLHPGFPCLTAPGVVTVLILPFLPVDRPVPSAGLRGAVARFIDRHRVIGSRVEVVGPRYVTVAVRTSVVAMPAAAPADVRAAVSTALDRFFHPLHGGPGGTGWPFGRDVYRSEVLQVIDDAPGVAHVLSLELLEEGGCPTCGDICIGPTALVDAGDHEVDVR
jgi:Baseplate J-like protein